MGFKDLDWTTKVELTNRAAKAFAAEIMSDQVLMKELTRIMGEEIGRQVAAAIVTQMSKTNVV